jgi:hypothetical protein
MSSSFRRRVVLLAALPAAFGLPAAAQAADVSMDGPILTYQAAPNETNRPVVTATVSDFIVRDGTSTTTLDARLGCRAITLREVRCAREAGDVIDLRLGDRDDQARVGVAGVPALVRGEAGRDTWLGGIVAGVSQVDFRGGDGFDLASYNPAGSFVNVHKNDVASDGRVGDHDNIRRDVEEVRGSRFDDTLVGWANPDGTSAIEVFDGGAGADFQAGLAGTDSFSMRSAADGADDVIGGAGQDTVNYGARTTAIRATIDHGTGEDDGEFGEGDDLDQVEVVFGSAGNDILAAAPGSTTGVALMGLSGADTILGSEGDDELYGEFAGTRAFDRIEARGGDDLIAAQDGEFDILRCGTGTDEVFRDAQESEVSGCEQNRLPIGKLRIAPKAVIAEAGEAARMRVSWSHPRSWRMLRSVKLRLRDGLRPVGDITVRPQSGRISDDGGVRLVQRATRLRTKGKLVSARLAVRFGDDLAAETLSADVIATDRRGRRQLELGAATVRIAK